MRQFLNILEIKACKSSRALVYTQYSKRVCLWILNLETIVLYLWLQRRIIYQKVEVWIRNNDQEADFGRSINPISTKEVKLCLPYFYLSPRFLDLPASLSNDLLYDLVRKNGTFTLLIAQCGETIFKVFYESLISPENLFRFCSYDFFLNI